MGLTIHYNQKPKTAAISDEMVDNCLDFVERVAEKEGWEILGRWNETVRGEDFPLPEWRKDEKPFLGNIVSKGISVVPHKDSEAVVISFANGELGLLNEYTRYDGSSYKDASRNFFCKTHYAGFNTHRKVCRLLSAIDKYFIPLEVYDEGDYYGIWNDKKGAENFGEYVAFVRSVGQAFSDALGADASVHIYKSEDHTDGWKDDYVDHLARKMAKGESTKAFTVSSKDLFNKIKNPKLKLDATDIKVNKNIRKKPL